MSPARNRTANKLPLAELLTRVADANAGFRHAEVIVQQRLYNFLMAESILLLAAAAILANSVIDLSRALFLFTVSLLGFVLSVAWAILGYRERIFLNLHMEIVESLEQQIEDPRYRVSEPIAHLRDGKKVIFPISKKEVELSGMLRFMHSSHVLIGAPIAFGVVFFVLMCAVFLK
jgi:hypothetical protein